MRRNTRDGWRGAPVKAALKKARLGALDVARATGISDRQVRNYLADRQFPPSWFRLAIAQFLRDRGYEGDVEELVAAR